MTEIPYLLNDVRECMAALKKDKIADYAII